MEISAGRHLLTDELGRRHIALSPEDADAVYDYDRSFWTMRQKQCRGNLPPWEIEKVIAGQVVTDTPYDQGERRKLREIFEATENFSMLESGAANRTVFERLGADDFRYVGFECMSELANDSLEKHSERKMVHVGGVEAFLDGMLPEYLSEATLPLLFYAHVPLIMIKPALVRAALKRASELRGQFLIYDSLDHPNHELELDGTLIFDMGRPEKWFIHDWDEYIHEVGFKIADKDMTPLSDDSQYDDQIHGCGYIHAAKS